MGIASSGGKITGFATIGRLVPNGVGVIGRSRSNSVNNGRFGVGKGNISVSIADGGSNAFAIGSLGPNACAMSRGRCRRCIPRGTRAIAIMSNNATVIGFGGRLHHNSLRMAGASRSKFIRGVRFHLCNASLSNRRIDICTAASDSNGTAFGSIPVNACALARRGMSIGCIIPRSRAIRVL